MYIRREGQLHFKFTLDPNKVIIKFLILSCKRVIRDCLDTTFDTELYNNTFVREFEKL